MHDKFPHNVCVEIRRPDTLFLIKVFYDIDKITKKCKVIWKEQQKQIYRLTYVGLLVCFYTLNFHLGINCIMFLSMHTCMIIYAFSFSVVFNCMFFFANCVHNFCLELLLTIMYNYVLPLQISFSVRFIHRPSISKLSNVRDKSNNYV